VGPNNDDDAPNLVVEDELDKGKVEVDVDAELDVATPLVEPGTLVEVDNSTEVELPATEVDVGVVTSELVVTCETAD
jgi:hypothetical protein